MSLEFATSLLLFAGSMRKILIHWLFCSLCLHTPACAQSSANALRACTLGAVRYAQEELESARSTCRMKAILIRHAITNMYLRVIHLQYYQKQCGILSNCKILAAHCHIVHPSNLLRYIRFATFSALRKEKNTDDMHFKSRQA